MFYRFVHAYHLKHIVSNINFKDRICIILYHSFIFFGILIISFICMVFVAKDGKEACLENNASVLRSLGGKEEEFDIYFEWDATEMGIPGAFYVKNHMKDEFFLVSMTLEYPLPTCDRHKDKNSIIHFLCNSWVHNHGCYKTHHRIFFDNNVSQTINYSHDVQLIIN